MVLPSPLPPDSALVVDELELDVPSLPQPAAAVVKATKAAAAPSRRQVRLCIASPLFDNAMLPVNTER